MLFDGRRPVGRGCDRLHLYTFRDEWIYLAEAHRKLECLHLLHAEAII